MTEKSSPVPPDSSSQPLHAPKHVRWQSRLLFFVALLCVLGVFFLPGDSDEPGRAPDGRLADASGDDIDLDSVMAPVTLVHFWSTWCPPCVEETPAIQRLAAHYSNRPEFALVMIAVADDKDAVGEFLEGADGSYYDDNWKVANSFGTEKLPETHLVVDGIVVRSFIGVTDWDSQAVRRSINDALNAAAGRG